MAGNSAVAAENSDVKKVYREGKLVFSETRYGGHLARLYFADSICIAIESDEDGDGYCETFIIFPEDVSKMDVFVRNKTGGVTLMPINKLNEYRDLKRCADETVNTILKTQLNKEAPHKGVISPKRGHPLEVPVKHKKSL